MNQLSAYLRSFGAAIPVLAFRASAGGLPIVVGLLIANRWGLAELAAFTVAHAMIAVGMVIVDWGATRALPRNLALLPPEGAAEFLASSNTLRLLLVVALAIGAALAAGGGLIATEVVAYLVILSALCPLIIVSTNGVSERVVARDTVGLGLAALGGLVTFAVIGAASVRLGFGPRWFAGAYVVSRVVEAAMIAKGRWWVLTTRRAELGPTASALLPFALQMILGVIYSRAGVFTVERLTTRAELGLFSVAVALQSALLLIPISLALIYFPSLTRDMRTRNFLAVRRTLGRYAVVSSSGVIAGLAILAAASRPLAGLLHLTPASIPFVIGFASVSLLSVFSTMFGFLMQAAGLESQVAWLSAVTLALALVYQLSAVSALGLWGIVAAVAAAEVTTIAVFGLALFRARHT